MLFKESENVELKLIVNDKAIKTIIAFANSNGGKLYIGVDDKGNPVGVKNSDKEVLKLKDKVKDDIEPDLTMFVKYNTLIIEDKEIIEVGVRKGTNPPYYVALKGLRPEGVYIRNGYASDHASYNAIRKMIKEADNDSFEEETSINQDLTFNKSKEVFKKNNLSFNLNDMKTLKLINSNNQYTNLAYILSDECEYTVKTAVFDGTQNNYFKDRKEFSGSLFKQADDIYKYLSLNNKLAASFDGLWRNDKYDYPDIALREALMNLLIHRDYSSKGSTLIKIYEDKIEFISMGGLIKDVTMDDVMSGVSACRNENLANIFYRLQLIEAYGTGIKKIFDAYKNEYRQPLLENHDNSFKITLPNLNYEEPYDFTSKPLEVNDSQVLYMAEEKGYITRKDIQDTFNTSQTSSGRILKKLKDEGKLSQLDKGKNTKYIIKK